MVAARTAAKRIVPLASSPARQSLAKGRAMPPDGCSSPASIMRSASSHAAEKVAAVATCIRSCIGSLDALHCDSGCSQPPPPYIYTSCFGAQIPGSCNWPSLIICTSAASSLVSKACPGCPYATTCCDTDMYSRLKQASCDQPRGWPWRTFCQLLAAICAPWHVWNPAERRAAAQQTPSTACSQQQSPGPGAAAP